MYACKESTIKNAKSDFIIPDTNLISNDAFGEMVKYGRELMVNTARYIGPNGINGKYLGNKMNCTNCHQDAGTKPYSFNLMRTHERYPQYRARENKVLTVYERINNCVMRPHSGIPLPHESKEMVALVSYLKWINSFVIKKDSFPGENNLTIQYPARAASSANGEKLYTMHCQRCHEENGEGKMKSNAVTYEFPPLWGTFSYQPGSSMHRNIVQARWLKANMPFDLSTFDKPVLTDEEALDIAAFVNDDQIHQRPSVSNFDYPNPNTKPIDYGIGPYADTFSENQHKIGPYQPIIDYWQSKGLNTPK
jgi:thiosulfate dehydrogenase